MINAKYRVRDVAKDLDVKTNYVTELIEKKDRKSTRLNSSH